jgi:hypothetical protein
MIDEDPLRIFIRFVFHRFPWTYWTFVREHEESLHTSKMFNKRGKYDEMATYHALGKLVACYLGSQEQHQLQVPSLPGLPLHKRVNHVEDF